MVKLFFISFLCLIVSFSTLGYVSAETGHHHHHSNASSFSLLSLNQGKRWQMDDHTRMSSRQMQKTFFDADHSSLSALNALGEELEHQLEGLIAGCTMNGEAHEQLHLFLNEHIATVAALSKASNYQSAVESAIKLKGQFESYQQYFE